MEATRISTADEMEVFFFIVVLIMCEAFLKFVFILWLNHLYIDSWWREIWDLNILCFINFRVDHMMKKVPKVSCDGSHSCLDIACSLMIINVPMKKFPKVSCDGSHSYLDIACLLMIINVLMKKFQRFLVMEVTGRLLVDGDCIKRKIKEYNYSDIVLESNIDNWNKYWITQFTTRSRLTSYNKRSIIIFARKDILERIHSHFSPRKFYLKWNPHINWIGEKITKWQEMKVEGVIYLIFVLHLFFYYFYSNNWNTQLSIPPSKHHNSWSSTMLFNRSIHLMNLINVRNLLIPRLKALKIRLMLEFPWQLLGDRNLLIPSLTVLKNRLILWLRLEFSWLLSDDLSILSFSLDCFTLCVLQPSLDNVCFG